MSKANTALQEWVAAQAEVDQLQNNDLLKAYRRQDAAAKVLGRLAEEGRPHRVFQVNERQVLLVADRSERNQPPLVQLLPLEQL